LLNFVLRSCISTGALARAFALQMGRGWQVTLD
jgi:hypothetical protein